MHLGQFFLPQQTLGPPLFHLLAVPGHQRVFLFVHGHTKSRFWLQFADKKEQNARETGNYHENEDKSDGPFGRRTQTRIFLALNHAAAVCGNGDHRTLLLILFDLLLGCQAKIFEPLLFAG